MKAKNFLDTYKKVIFLIGDYKLRFGILASLGVLIGFLEAIVIALLYPILSMSITNSSNTDFFFGFFNKLFVLSGMTDELLFYIIVFLSTTIVTFILKTFYCYRYTDATSDVLKRIGKKIFDQYTKFDYQYFFDKKEGELIHASVNGPAFIVALLAIILKVITDLSLCVFIFVITLFTLNLYFGIFLLGTSIFYFVFANYISVKIHYKAGVLQTKSTQDELSIMTETIGGVLPLKVFGAFPTWKNKFSSAVNRYALAYKKGYFWSQFPEIFVLFLIYFSIGGALLGLYIFYQNDFVTLMPFFGTAAFIFFTLFIRVMKFGIYKTQFMYILPNMEVIYDVLRESGYNKIVDGRNKFENFKSSIEFKHVSFSYNTEPLLTDVNLSVRKKETIAIVGSSGCGKSTIVRLLLRLFEINGGEILIDGEDIREYNISSIHNSIGFVSQEPFIFNGSITDNILFGRSVSNKELMSVIEKSGLSSFVNDLPEGLKTMVGHRGMRLSGGEKQRICIARAILCNPDILIFDEATSSLDNITQKQIQESIENISKDTTVIIVAHRLSTIENADIIYVLDDGKIVEKGTHKDLLKNKNLYAKLYDVEHSKSTIEN